jgi:hypothetical protein
MVNFKKLRQMLEIKGNGNIVSKQIQVSSFIRLHISAWGLTELIQSSEEKVIIETDENLSDCFQVVNSGRTLFISTEAKFRKPVFTHCKVKVYLRQINILYIRCEGGDVSCSAPIKLTSPFTITIQSVGNSHLNFQAPSIQLLSQSEGNVSISGTCQNLEIKNQSEGNFSSRELATETLTIKNMSVGNVEVFAEKQISIFHYGEGWVHYQGNAVLKDVKQFGSGPIRHIEAAV